MAAIVCEWISSGIAKKFLNQQRLELEKGLDIIQIITIIISYGLIW